MIKYRLCIFFTVYNFIAVVKAQQLPLFAQRAEYHGLINCASINSDFLTSKRPTSFGLSHRAQWVNSKLSKVSPSTQVLRGEHLFFNQDILVGGYIQRDIVGITENLSVHGRFAYVVGGRDLSDGGLSLGISAGLAQWTLNTHLLSLAQPDDPGFPLDPSFWYPDLDFGAYWYHNLGDEGRYLYVGASAQRLLNAGGEKYPSANRYPHFYGLAGFYWPFPWSEEGFVEISTWARKVEYVPAQYSLNLRWQPSNWWLGGGGIADFKGDPYYMVECGWRRNNIKVGYAFSWSGVSEHFGNTHEINLAFVIDLRE